MVGRDTGHPAYKIARNSFLFGLGMTTLCLGVLTTLINNWYTRKKVLAEQSELMLKRLSQSDRLQPQSFEQWVGQHSASSTALQA